MAGKIHRRPRPRLVAAVAVVEQEELERLVRPLEWASPAEAPVRHRTPLLRLMIPRLILRLRRHPRVEAPAEAARRVQ